MNETNIVALEIGSSKIKGAVGTVDSSGVVSVKAIEEEPYTDWVRYGVISNAEELSRHALNILDRLEARLGGATIQSAYVAIGGRSLRADAREKETLLPCEMEITEDVIEQLMNETAATVLPPRELLDVVPREYIVDKTRVAKPVGSLGSSVKMLSNVITCRQQMTRNIRHLVNEKLRVDILGFVVRQLAQADLVLTPEDRRLGCMLVDCGAETTTVSIYKHGHLQYLQTIPLGSRNITRDLIHLNMLEERAEKLKLEAGSAYGTAEAPADGSVSDMTTVNKYIAARAGEIIVNIKEQIKLAGYEAKDLPAGIILLGRGSRLTDFSDRLSKTTELKVRYGNPIRSDLRVSDPRILLLDSADILATLYYAARHNPQECLEKPAPSPKSDLNIKPEPTLETEPDAEPAATLRPKGGRKGGRLIDKFRARIVDLMSEGDESRDDDDDSIMRDDE